MGAAFSSWLTRVRIKLTIRSLSFNGTRKHDLFVVNRLSIKEGLLLVQLLDKAETRSMEGLVVGSEVHTQVERLALLNVLEFPAP